MPNAPLPPIPWDQYKSLGNLKAVMHEFGITASNPPDLCPFHADTKSHPSFNWFVDREGHAKWMCMSEGISGDIYEFVGRAYGIKDSAEQYDYVSRKFGGDGLQLKNRKPVTGPVLQPWAPRAPRERTRDLNAELSVQKFIEGHPLRESEVKKYLHDRGFLNTFVLDYMSARLFYWPGYEEALAAFGDRKLFAAGIPGRVKGEPSKWERPGVVSVLSMGWKLRYEDEDGKRQKMGSIGCKTILGTENFPEVTTFVEGEIDALAMQAADFRGVYALGRKDLSEEVIYEIIQRGTIKVLNVALDGDTPGKEGAGFIPGKDGTNTRSLPGKFRALGFKGEIRCVQFPNGSKDPAEMIAKEETARLRELIASAIRFEDIVFPEAKPEINIPVSAVIEDGTEPPVEGGFVWPFRYLGVRNNTHYFISRSQEVFEVASKSFTANSFLTIAPLEFWQKIKVNSRGNPDWDFMTNLVIDQSIAHGVYRPENIRGTGIWRDGDEIVFSDGLKVHSKTRGTHVVSEFPTKNNIYVMSQDLGLFEQKQDESQQKEDHDLIKWMTETISFKTPEHGKLLFGWIVSSMFLAILDWRPIAYMKGSSSVGKSWTINHIVRPLLYKISINPKNSSTVVGTMQAPGFDVRMITLDEMEGSNSQKSNDLVRDFIKLARDTSSNSAEKRYVGTADQLGSSLNFMSMFLFASIVESSTEDQDVNRITAIEFMKKENKIPWEEISQRITLAFRGGLAERIRGDIIYNREIVYKNIRTFVRVAAKSLKTQRNADQMGTLIGGWYYFENPGVEATDEEAERVLSGFDMTDQETRADGNTMKVIMGSIFSYKIRYETESCDKVTFRERSVYEMLYELQKQGPTPGVREVLNRELMTYGIRYGHPKYPGKLLVACNHEKIKSMLPKNFSYKENYKDYLKNHPLCCGILNCVKFSGTNYMALAFDIEFNDDDEGISEKTQKFTDKIPF